MKKIYNMVKFTLLTNINITKIISQLIIYFIVFIPFVIPIRQICSKYNVNVNLGILPILLSNKLPITILFILFILNFSNLPLIESNYNYVLVRTNKLYWLYSQIIYIIIQSFIQVSLFIVSITLCVFPFIDLNIQSWGKLFKTLSINRGFFETNSNYLLNVSKIYTEIYTVREAILKSIILLVLISILVGLLILIGNTIFINLGFILSCFILILNLFREFSFGRLFYYGSPLTWLNFMYLKNQASSSLPDYYTVICITIFSIILTIVNLNILVCKRGNLYEN